MILSKMINLFDRTDDLKKMIDHLWSKTDDFIKMIDLLSKTYDFIQNDKFF